MRPAGVETAALDAENRGDEHAPGRTAAAPPRFAAAVRRLHPDVDRQQHVPDQHAAVRGARAAAAGAAGRDIDGRRRRAGDPSHAARRPGGEALRQTPPDARSGGRRRAVLLRPAVYHRQLAAHRPAAAECGVYRRAGGDRHALLSGFDARPGRGGNHAVHQHHPGGLDHRRLDRRRGGGNLELPCGVLRRAGDDAGGHAVPVAVERRLGRGVRFQPGEINQRLIAVIVAHVAARLQAAAHFRPQRRMKQAAAQPFIQVNAAGLGGLA